MSGETLYLNAILSKSYAEKGTQAWGITRFIKILSYDTLFMKALNIYVERYKDEKSSHWIKVFY